MTEETKIFVIYVGVAGVRAVDIPDVVRQISQRITPETLKGEILIIPQQSLDTRVECINPRYVTDAELIKENNKMMAELKLQLLNQMEQLKENKDG
jgi:hypothetical protein